MIWVHLDGYIRESIYALVDAERDYRLRLYYFYQSDGKYRYFIDKGDGGEYIKEEEYVFYFNNPELCLMESLL